MTPRNCGSSGWGRYTSNVVRNASPAALAGLVVVILALAPGDVHARKSRPSPAQALGQAYRALEAQDFATAHALAASIGPGQLRNDDYRLYVLAQSASLLG